MRTIISTVGTSLLTNAKRQLGAAELSQESLLRFLIDVSPVDACAETNCLHRIVQEQDNLVFVCSATAEGRLCAETLAKHFARQGYTTSVREVEQLSYEHKKFKQLGLRNLVSALTELIRTSRRSGRTPAINATGGFKAEIAYATVVGLLFDVPVYYIHEAFKDVVEMPATPVSWDYGLMFDYEDFFEWINSDLRPSGEVRSRFRALGSPNEVRDLLIEDNGYAYLSPTGEALLDAYRDAVYRYQVEPVYLSDRARNTLERMDPTTQARFQHLLARLRIRPLWISRAERVHNSDCLVWPRGHRDERCFFYVEDDAIRVCELARHSDESYENLLKRGVMSREYDNFTPWAEVVP